MKRDAEAKRKLVDMVVPKLVFQSNRAEEEGQITESFLTAIDIWSFSGRVFL
jgi:hypothetical protein